MKAPLLPWLGRVAAVFAVQALVLAHGVAPARAQSMQPVNGSGSTWSFNALNAWIGDVRSNGITINFSPVGSTRGRADFRAGTTDFGISEIPYQGSNQDERGQRDEFPDRGFGYMPIVAGGTAFMYNIQVRGQPYRGLRLSGETIARIFTGQITRWSDPAITADNNGVQLPDKRIVPVVRSDGSGTTAQFTTFLDKLYPSIWRPFFGRSGLTSYYPNPNNVFVAQNGSDGVQRYVSSESYGDGSIGYVEYSYALVRNWPVAKVLNEAGYYVLPTQYNVAVALTRAQIETGNQDPRFYLTQKLDRVYNHPDQRAYPLSSYSYMILPTDTERDFNEGKGLALSRFAFYFLCEGQQKAGPLGYSPLPLNLVMAGFDQVRRIPGNEGERLTDPARCNNPTFDGRDPDRNLLAEIAPEIPECDRIGQGPCTGDEGGGGNGAGNGGGENGGAGSGAGPGAGAGDGSGEAAAGAGAAIDPETGLPIGAAAGEAGALGPSGLASSSEESLPVSLGVLAALELLLVLFLPGLVGRQLSRRHHEKPAPPRPTNT
jgi:phosphate transport system substrate-binding protein